MAAGIMKTDEELTGKRKSQIRGDGIMSMEKLRNAFIGFAVFFGVAAIVLYISSIRELDEDSARLLGASALANIPATVYCAAAAILFAMNTAGAMVMFWLEDKEKEEKKKYDDQERRFKELSDQMKELTAKFVTASEKTNDGMPVSAEKKSVTKETGLEKKTNEAMPAASGKSPEVKKTNPAEKKEKATREVDPNLPPQGIFNRSGNPEFIEDGTGRCELCKKTDVPVCGVEIHSGYSILHRNVCRECFEKKKEELVE